MRSTVEVFSPFSFGTETMDNRGFFPTKNDGWANYAMIVEPGTEAIIYQVEIPDEDEEIEGNTEGVILSGPVTVLNVGDTVYLAEEYINDDEEGFTGFPQVSLVKQVGNSLYN
jgi:hypothetical protein